MADIGAVWRRQGGAAAPQQHGCGGQRGERLGGDHHRRENTRTATRGKAPQKREH